MVGMTRLGTIARAGLAASALLVCLWAASAAEQAPAQPPAQPPSEQKSPEQAPPEQPVIRKIGPDLFQVGALRLDAKKRTIRCPGKVVMSEGGPLDLLASLPTGKTYESIFALSMRPMDLQVALLLLGLEPGRNPAYKYPEGSADLQRKPGDEVLIYVEWQPKPKPGAGDQSAASDAPKVAAKEEAPAPVRVPAEQFLLNQKTKQPMTDAHWAFLGSRIVDGRFGADLEGSLIATYHDPLSILELAHHAINEDQYTDMTYAINAGICPPVGTPVDLVIEAPRNEQPPQPKTEPSKGAPAVEAKAEPADQSK